MEIWESLAALLLERYRNRRWAPGDTFPSLTELSREFRISRTTATRLVHKLSRERVIVYSPQARRYHFHDLPAAAQTRTDDHALSRHLRIARQLREEIELGKYTVEGVLPGNKVLRARFGCHHVTMAKALAALEHDGVVRKSGRALLLSTTTGAAAEGARVVIAGCALYVNTLHPSILALVTAAQDELRSRGWPPAQSFVVDDPLGSMAPDLPAVAGHVYLTYGKELPWNRFFARNARVPLVCVDLSEQYQPPIRPTPYCTIRPDNFRAGNAMAQHLRALGHRHLAFFSHVSARFNWAKRRLDGIKEVYSADHCSVRVFGNPPASPRPEGAPFIEPGTIELNGREMTEILPPAYARSIGSARQELASYEIVERSLRPLFAEALEGHRQISAWVCVNDHVAMLAHSFLRSRGVEIGREISLCGFDNHPMTDQLEITSYDFDFSDFGRAAIGHLCRSDRPKAKSETRITGHILPRKSTGRCGHYLPKRTAREPGRVDS